MTKIKTRIMTDGGRNFQLNADADRIKKFDSGLDEIEQKHIGYFKSREPKWETQKHDQLSNHYFFTAYNQLPRTIGFHSDSDLRQDIKQEIIDLFKQIWK